MKKNGGTDKFGGAALALLIAAIALLAAAAFLITPAFLSRFANDGVIAPDKYYFIRLLRVSLALGSVVCLSGIATLRRSNLLGGVRAETGAPAIELFAVSFLILFLELTLIRWVPAYVKIMTYFSNFILLAAFLGMGLGCLAANARWNLLRATPFLLAAVGIISLSVYCVAVLTDSPYIVGGLGGREMVYFGFEVRALDTEHLREAVTVGITGFIFVLITLVFVGPGQKLGVLFEKFDNPVRAYCVNIGASIAGIVCFGLLSFLTVPAWAWFAVTAALLLWLLARDRAGAPLASAAMLVVLFAAVFAGNIPPPGSSFFWSPYYRIHFNYPMITVNQIGHQIIRSTDNDMDFNYHLPHLLERDAAGRRFDNVMIIGAGSGNDVSHALLYGAKHIDAVEIDPVILKIGKKNHPNKPYAHTDRVRIINDDGRSFLKSSQDKYDLVVYAAVDSLTLMSNFSSVRLENYLFTEDAFREVKNRLKPGGVFAVYNFYRENWLAIRLYRMLENVFGEKPVLILLPPKKQIGGEGQVHEYMSVFLVGDTDAIMRKFAASGGEYTILKKHPERQGFNGFTDSAKGSEGFTVFSTRVPPGKEAYAPRDNRPFFYLKQPRVPAHNIWGLLLVAGISVAGVAAAAGVKGIARVSPHFFFLGGAFMLLETQSIVKLALIHGSTWFVNSVVFVCVLAMILGANLIVLKKPMRSSAVVWALLFASLAVNYFVTPASFLGHGFLMETVVSSLLLFVPLFFAGIIFANSFRASKQPELDLGANLLGVIAGGIAEYASLMFGYNILIIIAAAMYAVALLSRPRNT